MSEEKVAINTKALLEFLLLPRKKNFILVVMSGFVCALIAVGVVLQMKNTYQAQAKIVVNKPAFKSELSPEPLSVKTCENFISAPWIIERTRQEILEMHEHIRTLFESNTSPSADITTKANRVANMSEPELKEALGIDTKRALHYMNLTPSDIIALHNLDVEDFRDKKVETLQKGVNTQVRIERKTNVMVEYSPILTIWAKMNSPHIAKLFINTLAREFVDLYSNVTTGQTEASLRLIDDKYKDAQQNLEQTEDAITAFVEQYKLDLIKNQISVLEGKIKNQTQTLKDAQQELGITTSERRAINEHLIAMKDEGSWMGYFRSETALPNSSGDTSTNPGTETLNASDEASRLRTVLNNIKQDYLATDKNWVEFFEKYRIDTVIEQLDSLRAVQSLYQEKLYDARLSAESLEQAVAELQGQLKNQARTLSLQRGVSEDVLGEILTGKPSPEELKKIEKIVVTDEDINPTYVEMANQLFQYQTELELNKSRAQRLEALLEDIDSRLSKLEETYAAGINRQDQLVFNKNVVDDAYSKMANLYVSLEKQEKELGLSIDKLKGKITELEIVLVDNEQEVSDLKDLYQEKSTELDRLERQKGVYKRTFTNLAEDRDQASIAVITSPPDVRLAVPAVAPTEKVGPPRSIIVIIAGILGLVTALAITFIFHTIAILKRLRREEELV